MPTEAAAPPRRDTFARRLLLLAAVGIVLAAAMPALAHLLSGRISGTRETLGSHTVKRIIVGAFVPYGVALAVVWRRRIAPSRALVTGVAVACAIPLLASPPPFSTDIFMYLMYGRMLTGGHLNPLAVEPARMARDVWFARVAWPHMPSAYGPAWIAICALAALAWPHVVPAALGLKMASFAGAAAGAFAVSRYASDNEGVRDRVLLTLLWNPLLLFMTAGDGHIDGVLFGLVGVALLARTRGRMGAATVALLVASLMKISCVAFLALHLIALIYERRPARDVARQLGLTASLAAVAYAPLWAGRATVAGIVRTSQVFAATLPDIVHVHVARALIGRGEPVAHALHVGRAAATAAAAGALVVLFAAVALRVTRRSRPEHAWSLGFAAVLLTQTWFAPWHVLPLLAVAVPDARAHPEISAAALAFSVTSFDTAQIVRFGVPVAVALVTWVWLALQRRRQPEAAFA